MKGSFLRVSLLASAVLMSSIALASEKSISVKVQSNQQTHGYQAFAMLVATSGFPFCKTLAGGTSEGIHLEPNIKNVPFEVIEKGNVTEFRLHYSPGFCDYTVDHFEIAQTLDFLGPQSLLEVQFFNHEIYGGEGVPSGNNFSGECRVADPKSDLACTTPYNAKPKPLIDYYIHLDDGNFIVPQLNLNFM